MTINASTAEVQAREPSGTLDRIAMALSAACLVHCVATAVLVGMLSTLGELFGSPLIHEYGLALAIVLGAVSLGRGLLEHRRPVPLLLGGLGLAVMAAALFLPHGLYESSATVVGVSFLAWGHYLNRVAHKGPFAAS